MSNSSLYSMSSQTRNGVLLCLLLLLCVDQASSACLPGSYLHVQHGPGGSALTRCHPCPQGTHQPVPGQRVCIPCPVNSHSDVGSTHCTCVNHAGSPSNMECLRCANQFSPQLNPSHFEWLVVADAYQRQSIANIEMNINDADRQNTPCSHVDVAFAADTPPATSSVFFIDSSQIQNQIMRLQHRSEGSRRLLTGHFKLGIIARDRGVPPRETKATVGVNVVDLRQAGAVPLPARDIIVSNQLNPGDVIVRFHASGSALRAPIGWYLGCWNRQDCPSQTYFSIERETGVVSAQVSLQAFAGQDLEFAVKANTGGMFGSGAPRNITYRVHVHVRLSCHELRSSFDRFTKNCASPVPPLHRQGDTDKPNSPGVHARFVVSHSGLFSKMAMLRLNPMVIAEPSIAGFKLYNDKKGVELLALGDPQLQCDGDLVCSIKLSPALNLTAGDHVRAHFERLSVEHIREVRLIGYKYVDSCHLAAELNPTCMQSYSHLQERLAWDSQNNQGQCASDLVQLGDVIHDYYKSCQPVAPRIHIMPTDTAYIVRGQTVQLHCSVLANPAPMVKWIGPAGNSLPFPLRKDLDNPKVVVATIAVGTPGMYVCTASNYLAQVRSSVMVQIQDGPAAFATPRQITVMEGAPRLVRFVCSAKGQPPIKFTWRRADGRLISRRAFSTGPVLAFRQPRGADSGVYVCEATNPSIHNPQHQTSTAEVQLTVHNLPDLTMREPVIAVAHHPVTFHLQADIYPKLPEYTSKWSVIRSRMDYPLPNHIQPTRDGLGLQLLSPKVSDTGVYRVEVKLPMGIAKGVVRLIVHSAPTVILNAQKNGYAATLMCQTTGVPMPAVQWMRNGIPMQPRRVSTNSPTEAMVEIVVRSAGDYSCHATNYLGTESQSLTITVTELPAAPLGALSSVLTESLLRVDLEMPAASQLADSYQLQARVYSVNGPGPEAAVPPALSVAGGGDQSHSNPVPTTDWVTVSNTAMVMTENSSSLLVDTTQLPALLQNALETRNRRSSITAMFVDPLRSLWLTKAPMNASHAAQSNHGTGIRFRVSAVNDKGQSSVSRPTQLKKAGVSNNHHLFVLEFMLDSAAVNKGASWVENQLVDLLQKGFETSVNLLDIKYRDTSPTATFVVEMALPFREAKKHTIRTLSLPPARHLVKRGYLDITPFNSCPEGIIHTDPRGHLAWTNLDVGATAHIPCPSVSREASSASRFDALTRSLLAIANRTNGHMFTAYQAGVQITTRKGFASRTCLRDPKTGHARWGAVYSRDCAYSRPITGRLLEQLEALFQQESPFNSSREVLSVNVIQLRKLITTPRSVSAADLHLIIYILDALLAKVTEIDREDAQSVVNILDRLLHVSSDVLSAADKEQATVARVLAIIDDLAGKIILPKAQQAVEVSSENLVFDVICESRLPKKTGSGLPLMAGTKQARGFDTNLNRKVVMFGTNTESISLRLLNSNAPRSSLLAARPAPVYAAKYFSTLSINRKPGPLITEDGFTGKLFLEPTQVPNEIDNDINQKQTTRSSGSIKKSLLSTLASHAAALPSRSNVAHRPLLTPLQLLQMPASKLGLALSGRPPLPGHEIPLPSSSHHTSWQNESNLIYKVGPKEFMKPAHNQSMFKRGQFLPTITPSPRQCRGNRLLFVKVSGKLFPMASDLSPQATPVVASRVLIAKSLSLQYSGAPTNSKSSSGPTTALLTEYIQPEDPTAEARRFNGSQLAAHLAKIGGGDGKVRCAQWIPASDTGRGIWSTTTCQQEDTGNNTYNCYCTGEGPVALITFPIVRLGSKNHHVAPILASIGALSLILVFVCVRNRLRERKIVHQQHKNVGSIRHRSRLATISNSRANASIKCRLNTVSSNWFSDRRESDVGWSRTCTTERASYGSKISYFWRKPPRPPSPKVMKEPPSNPIPHGGNEPVRIGPRSPTNHVYLKLEAGKDIDFQSTEPRTQRTESAISFSGTPTAPPPKPLPPPRQIKPLLHASLLHEIQRNSFLARKGDGRSMSSDDVNAACYSNSELSDETTTSPYSVVDLSSASQESTLPRDFDDDGRDWSETSSNENEDDSAYDNQEEEDETEGDEEEEGEEGATGRHDPFVIELNHKLYAIGQYSPSSNSFQAVIDPRLPPRARDHQRRPAPRLPRRVWLREDGDGDEPRYADDPLGKDTRRK